MAMEIKRPWWRYAVWPAGVALVVAIGLGLIWWSDAARRDDQTAALVRTAGELERCLLGDGEAIDLELPRRAVERTIAGELSPAIQRDCLTAAAAAVEPIRAIRDHAPARPLWDALFEVDRSGWNRGEGLAAEDACARVAAVRTGVRTLRGEPAPSITCMLDLEALVVRRPDDVAWGTYWHDGMVYAHGWDSDAEVPWIQRTRDAMDWEALEIPAETSQLYWRGDHAWATVWRKRGGKAYASRDAGWRPGARARGRLFEHAWARTATGWRLVVDDDAGLLVRDLDPAMQRAVDTPLEGVPHDAEVIVTEAGDVTALFGTPAALELRVLAAGGTVVTEERMELRAPPDELRWCRDGELLHVVVDGWVVRSDRLGRSPTLTDILPAASYRLACSRGRLYAGDGETLHVCDGGGCASRPLRGTIQWMRPRPEGVGLLVDVEYGEHTIATAVVEVLGDRPLALGAVYRPIFHDIELDLAWLR
jgi:hypothetical protein